MGGRVWVASCSGLVYAFEPTSGAVAWSYDTSSDARATFHGDAVVTDELVVFGSESQFLGYVYAFDAATGELRWRTSVPGGLETDLVSVGDTLFGLDRGADLVALDLATGELLWRLPPEAEPEFLVSAPSPAAAGNHVYFATGDGRVRAVEGRSPEPIWSTDLGARPATSVAVAGGHLLVGTHDGRLLRLDREDGRIVGELKLPWPARDRLGVAGDRAFVLVAQNILAAVDTRLEGILWQYSIEEEWTTYRPMVLGEHVLVGSGAGELVALRIEDGGVAWTIKLDGRLRGLGHARGMLYVGTIAGTIYAWAPEPTADVKP